MFRIVGWSFAGFALLICIFISAGRATNAVAYCKTVGVPKGCVVRPVAAAVVVATVAGPVVHCKPRGVPKGCFMR